MPIRFIDGVGLLLGHPPVFGTLRLYLKKGERRGREGKEGRGREEKGGEKEGREKREGEISGGITELWQRRELNLSAGNCLGFICVFLHCN